MVVQNKATPYIRRWSGAICLGILLYSTSVGARIQPTDRAELIFYNGKIITVDKDFTIAQALAVSGDKIVALGDNTGMLQFGVVGATLIDLNGATVLPGLNDSHIHLAAMGRSLGEINLREKSFEQIRTALAARIARSKPGEVIQGVGWSAGYLGRLPTKEDIDTVSPDNPVIFQEVGHAVWLNTKALELVGLSKASQAPAHAVFERNTDGDLTGVLHEARGLISRLITQRSDKDKKQAIVAGLKVLTTQGITSMTEPGVSADAVRLYRELEQEGSLTVRATLHLRPGRNLQQIKASLTGFGDTLKGAGTTSGLLTLRGIKMQIDGAPPGRTALMFDDYACCPGVKGLMAIDGDTEAEQIQEFDQSIQWLHDQGYQVGIHADGDRGAHLAIASLINAMQNSPTDADHPHRNDLRHYLIHGDLVADEDIARMTRWNIGLAIQPVITYAAGHLLLELWGPERGARHMATGLFVKAGIWTTLGSDSPVVPVDWKQNIEYAVLRQSKFIPHRNGLPEYSISVKEAIIAHTITAAYQDFQEQIKGSLERGKYADLVVLQDDILSINPQDISAVRTLMTVVGGKIVYDSGDLNQRH